MSLLIDTNKSTQLVGSDSNIYLGYISQRCGHKHQHRSAPFLMGIAIMRSPAFYGLSGAAAP